MQNALPFYLTLYINASIQFKNEKKKTKIKLFVIHSAGCNGCRACLIHMYLYLYRAIKHDQAAFLYFFYKIYECMYERVWRL